MIFAWRYCYIAWRTPQISICESQHLCGTARNGCPTQSAAIYDFRIRSPLGVRRSNSHAGNQGCTGGRLSEPEVFRHVGWPKPPLLLPVPPLGFAVMSNTMLSGRAGSPETPPTAGKEPEAARWSKPNKLRKIGRAHV